MISSGVSIVRCLKTLEEEETSGELREAACDLRTRIEAGETLSEAMRAWPAVFPEPYLALIRAGEVGGVLERVLLRLATRLEAGLVAGEYAEEAPVTRVDLADWFWCFWQMLDAGVPLLTAVQTLAESGPPVLREVSQQMAREIAAGFSLAPISAREEAPGQPLPAMWRYSGIFTPTVRQLVGIGVWFGPLVNALRAVSDLLDHEAAREASGELPPLSVAPADGPIPVAPEVEHPVIRQVNDFLKTIVRSEVEWVELSPTQEGHGKAVLRKGENVLTEHVDQYAQVVRRLKLLAGLDPFARDEGATYRRSQIYLRLEGQDYKLTVRSGGDRLVLGLSSETGTVEL
jgi:hypothetical protein